MKIALAQINPIVGDLDGNSRKIIDFARRAQSAGAHLVLFPELGITGYPPKDLLLKPRFVRMAAEAVDRIATACPDLLLVVGCPWPNNSGAGKPLYNAAVICAGGKVVRAHGKNLLPNYDIFDETRYFAPDPSSDVSTYDIDGRSWKLGFSICEDLWNDEQFAGHKLYAQDPIADLASTGVDLVLNISASPFSLGKQDFRVDIFSKQAAEHKLPIVCVNQVGGNDELIFDGGSAIFDASGALVAQTTAFDEDLLIADTGDFRASRVDPYPQPLESVYRALLLGTRDYVRKCGFDHVVLGLSGGIDSAVTACLAVQALGPDKVHGVAMPSRYSSDHSQTDAAALAQNLGIDYRTIPIEGIHAATESLLAGQFGESTSGITEENIQARTRGNLLMALSNKFGWLLLTTGNKSELAVGYCTLYGDMCGGLAVISDVPKMMVYQLARYINQQSGWPIIPESTITKPPSAELRENQTDQDSLPPYEELDDILARYVELDQSADEIAAAGHDRATVAKVIQMVDRNEYKRKQAAIGLKVTSRAFGSGRRMPIAAKYL